MELQDEVVPVGAYVKGTLWKWGSRAAGGGIGWLVLLVAVGEPLGGVLMFLFSIVLAIPLSYRAGLALRPTERGLVKVPQGRVFPWNLYFWGLRIQDRIGDLALTFSWNRIRAMTDKRH